VKRYRLLVDWSVVQQLQSLPPRLQRLAYAVFARLEDVPDAASDFSFADQKGRQLEVFIIEDWAFYYWIDFADRHVKVLALEPADHREN